MKWSQDTTGGPKLFKSETLLFWGKYKITDENWRTIFQIKINRNIHMLLLIDRVIIALDRNFKRKYITDTYKINLVKEIPVLHNSFATRI